MVFLAGLMLIAARPKKAVKFTAQNKKAMPVCPAFDTTNVIISPSDCNANNGSIIGLQGTGTGTLVFTWRNQNGMLVGNFADLTGVNSGEYIVVLSDSSKCLAVTKSFYVGVRNPEVIDNTNTVITSPGCNQNNGSITNINTGNAVTFQWIDNNYTPLANTKDITGVGAGVYILTATNATGCSAQARYTISPGNYAPILTYYTYTNSDCKATGTFSATFNLQPTDPSYTYTLVDSTGNIAASGGISYNPLDSTRASATGLPPGKYSLVTVGTGRCFDTLATFTIQQSVFAIDTAGLGIYPGICGQNTGVISGVEVTGGPRPSEPAKHPYTGYFWRDSTGKQVGALLYLYGVNAGRYTLVVVNDDSCVTAPVTFVVPDSISAATAPIVNNVKICLPATIALYVQNKDPKAHYRLYDSAKTVIDSSVAGYFVQKVAVTTIYYIGSIKGICPSPLAKVKVTVEDPGVSFPNAFTPNNDGINDYWQINGLENYPGTEVSVFNRYGQRVYHSINYSSPFDGRSNGGELPAGVYYYIIDTKKPGCQAGITGNLTIIR